jgi:hypothetical protein
MNHELERKYKEVAMTYLKVLSENSPRETEENHEKSVFGSWAPPKIHVTSLSQLIWWEIIKILYVCFTKERMDDWIDIDVRIHDCTYNLLTLIQYRN